MTFPANPFSFLTAYHRARRRLFFGLLLLLTAPGIFAEESLRIGIYTNPPTLDVTAGSSQTVREIMHENVLEGLTAVTDDNRIIPRLAESWEERNGGMTYRFLLRQDVQFHDGNPFLAESVVYTLQRRMAAEKKQTGGQSLLTDVRRVVAEDKHTLIIEGNSPLYALPEILALPELAVVSPKSVMFLPSEPIGTGPYAFVLRDSAMIRLERNPVYYGARPDFDAVEFMFFPPAGLLPALQAGQIDGVQFFPAPSEAAAMVFNDGYSVDVGYSQGQTVLSFNAKRRPFNRPELRKAVIAGINRNALTEDLFARLSGDFEPPPQFGGGLNQTLPEALPYDPALAKTLLRQAGYRRGLQEKLIVPPSAIAQRTAERLSEQLAEIGVRLIVRTLPWDEWQKRVFVDGLYTVTVIPVNEWENVGLVTPDHFLFNYPSAALKQALSRLKGAGDSTAVKLLARSIQHKIIQDAVTVHLFQIPKIAIWRKGFKGYRINAPVSSSPVYKVHYVQP